MVCDWIEWWAAPRRRVCELTGRVPCSMGKLVVIGEDLVCARQRRLGFGVGNTWARPEHRPAAPGKKGHGKLFWAPAICGIDGRFTVRCVDRLSSVVSHLWSAALRDFETGVPWTVAACGGSARAIRSGGPGRSPRCLRSKHRREDIRAPTGIASGSCIVRFDDHR